MKFNSNSGFSLIEIGIALIVVGIFMTASVSLLSASNNNYRMVEQRSIALSYAMQAIESIRLGNKVNNLAEIKNKALSENNMTVTTQIENAKLSDGSITEKAKIVTANVEYHIKGNDAGSLKTFTLQTLMIEE